MNKSEYGNMNKLSAEQHRNCARVAHFYYEKGLSQEEIGSALGMSRVSVSRTLKLARQSGVVETRIHFPDEPFFDLEQEVLTKFSLRDVRIVSTSETDDLLLSDLSKLAAGWLVDQVRPGHVVGLGLGRTISRMGKYFAPGAPVDCCFMTLEGVGSFSRGGFSSYDITAKLAEAIGGQTKIISAPTYVSSPEIKQTLVVEPTISEALEHARNADIAMQSVGTLDADSVLVQQEAIDANALAELTRRGAVGDALGYFFDEAGNHLYWSTDDVKIGLALHDLARLDISVLVAGGQRKHRPILGALRGGWFNVLLTDADTARFLVAAQ